MAVYKTNGYRQMNLNVAENWSFCNSEQFWPQFGLGCDVTVDGTMCSIFQMGRLVSPWEPRDQPAGNLCTSRSAICVHDFLFVSKPTIFYKKTYSVLSESQKTP